MKIIYTTNSTIRDLFIEQVEEHKGDVEKIIEKILSQGELLAHGSDIFPENRILTTKNDTLYGTNHASIALLKAILSNKGLREPGIKYPYEISAEKPLEVEIYGAHKETIRTKGYVHFILKSKFKNVPIHSWQFETNTEREILASIEVKKEDFKYPVYKDNTKERIFN